MVQQLISKGEIEKAIDLMLSNCNDDNLLEEINLQSQRFHTNERQNRQGLITLDQYLRIQNKIVFALQKINIPTTIAPPCYSNTSTSRSSSIDILVTTNIENLKTLKKKVRFGFSKELKNNLETVLNLFIDYQGEKIRDDLYDSNEEVITGLKSAYREFIKKHSLELRTKNKVKVSNIKELLKKLESDFSRENARVLVDALIGFNVKYTYLSDSFEKVTSVNLENFCCQLGEIVDGLTI